MCKTKLLGISLPWIQLFRNSVHVSRRKKMGMVRIRFLRLHSDCDQQRHFACSSKGSCNCQALREWVTLTSFHLLYFIGMENCHGFLKPFTGSHCIFGAFDQEQQRFERTSFTVGKGALFTSSLCLGSLTCRPRIH